MLPPTETFDDFLAIVRRLRTDCPWDREQTHESIAPRLIEEAYEVKESIQEKDDKELSKELGDILLHVVMHSVIAEERGAFRLDDVIKGISTKLVARHPHVYGEVGAADASEVERNWEKLKLKEGRSSVLDGTPKAMPALQRAERVQEKAAHVGFDWENPEDVWKKVEEELGELRSAVVQDDRAAIEEEFGDTFFALVNYARFLKVQPEDALHGTINKFIRRFRYIESRLAEQNKSFEQVSLAEMDGYWEEAKKVLSVKC